MNDYIGRQAAIEALRRAEALTRAFGYHNVIDTIRELPSVQPEIIRCKDCKYSSPNTVYGCRIEPFSYLDDGMRMYSDDYCSRGERRDG